MTVRRKLLLRWLWVVAGVWLLGALPWAGAEEARRFGAALLLVGPWLPLFFDLALQGRRARWAEVGWRVALLAVAASALV